MTDNMKAFMDALKNNEELKKKFDEISNKEQAEQKDYNDEYIALGKECGITLTDEDFELDEEDLSDEDLENVSGGFFHISEATGVVIHDAMETARRRREEQRSQSQGQTEDQNY